MRRGVGKENDSVTESIVGWVSIRTVVLLNHQREAEACGLNIKLRRMKSPPQFFYFQYVILSGAEAPRRISNMTSETLTCTCVLVQVSVAATAPSE